MQLTTALNKIKLAAGKGLLKTAISNIGSTFSLRLIGSFISISFELLLIRALGYSNYSEYTYVWVFVRLSGILSSLGFENLVVRFVSEYSHNRNLGKLKGLILCSYLIVTAVSTMFLLGILFMSTTTYVQSFLSIKNVLDVFYIASTAIILIAIQELQTGILRGFGKVTHAVFWQSVAFPAAMSTLILILGNFVPDSLYTKSVATISVLVLFVIIVWQFIFVIKQTRVTCCSEKGFFRNIEFMFKPWLKIAFTMFVIRNGEQVMQRLQIFIAGTMFGTAVVGFYNVAYRLVSLISYGLLVSNLATAHLFARTDLQKQRDKMQGLITLVAYITFFLTAPLVAIFFLGIEPVLGYFGDEFLDGKYVLQVLLIAAAINTITGPNLIVLMMMGAHQGLVLLNVASIIFNLFLIFTLSPIFGYIGIAIAGSTAWIGTNIIVTILVRKRTGYNSTIFSKLNLKGLARE